MNRLLVAGVGNPDRGDDGAGPQVVARIALLGLPGLDLIEQAEPLDLVPHLRQRDHVVIVDASAPRGRPGRVRVQRVGDTALTSGGLGGGGTHGFGVVEAVELARSLGPLPSRLVLIGVEAATFEHSRTLSPAVHAGLDAAIQAVLAAITPEPWGPARSRRSRESW